MNFKQQRTVDTIAQQADTITAAAAALYCQLTPTTNCCDSGAGGQKGLVSELQDHLNALTNAVLMDSPALFETHLAHARRQPTDPTHDQELTQQLAALKQVLAQRLPIGEYITAAGYLNAALTELERPVPVPSPTQPEAPKSPLKPLADAYLAHLLAGQRTEAISLLRKEAKEGTDVRLIYEQVFMPVQREVGLRWHQGDISVAQEHYCTAATELAMAMLHPYLKMAAPNGFSFVATTVSGDLHGMPVRMVADFLEFDGWTPYFLGANTPTEGIWKAVVGFQANLLVIGASMTHHVGILRQLISAKHDTIGADRICVMVGGEPFNADPNLWRAIGADAYAPNARAAVQAARDLMRGPLARPAHSSS